MFGFSIVSINKPIVVSNTAEIVMAFGVPVPYLYWMGVIEFFHRLNLLEYSVLPQDRRHL